MIRDLNALTKKTKKMAEELEKKAKEKYNIDIITTGTYRSFLEQDNLYAIGRTRPGKIITNAKGGQSFHNCRRAVDVAIIKNKKVSYSPFDGYFLLGRLGKEIGFDWGGDFTKIIDMPHFENRWCEKHKTKHKNAICFNENGSCKK